MAKKVSAKAFAAFLKQRAQAKDGYIMGATGQNPRKWSRSSWWFTQYSGSQRTQALQWRETAERVWDCNGMAEGYYRDVTGVDINTRARYNYSGWCGVKGKGSIPVKYRVPGAAVFKGSPISHVGFLVEPVTEGKPEGDWWVVEARGVAHGVVRTKLSARGWTKWGLMDKYFDYTDAQEAPEPLALGERILKNGSEGDDVRELQTLLISLGYDCGRWGADGDYGDATELAVMAFQKNAGLDADGTYGPETHAALMKTLAEADKPVEEARRVRIVGGDCWVRTAPNTQGAKLGVAHAGEALAYGGEESEGGWLLVAYRPNGATVPCNGWVSGKYGALEEGA